jgi:cob(I)alamin adenosyltransferase
MKIYTKTGDKGESSLYNGTRLPKSSEYFDALGDLDELNSHLAMVRALWREIVDKSPGNGVYEWFALGAFVQEIQKNIMDISSTIATPECGDRFFHPAWVLKIEEQIDRLTSLTPPLTKFVIPSGNKLVASIHIARSVCRRAERVTLTVVEPGCPSHLYLNRLSDYLFMLSRFACVELKIQEDVKN